MSAYEPGTVAIATVRGVPNVRIFRSVGPLSSCVWSLAEGIPHTRLEEGGATDIRPLVVLDWHPSPTHVQDLLVLLRENYWTSLADQIEAQVTPPRIPEPTWSGVVEAHTAQNSDRLRWQRDSGSHSEHWVCEDTLEYDRPWDALIDPALVRHGIQDES